MENHVLCDKLVLLQTYDPQEGAADGLSLVFDRIRAVGGALMQDTSTINGVRILVCGIPFLYEKRLSPGNFNILYTTFESSCLPSFWVSSINNYYQHCIVPHAAVKKVFQQSGVSIPVSVIHQGFTRHHKYPRPVIQNKPFSIGFLGVPVNRKNFKHLYNVCKKLGENDIPHIKLVVHCASFYEWLDEDQFSHIKNDPLVTWSGGKYKPDQIARWYHGLSCYIFPSSGEGWSFTPRESLYLGIPTIISDIPVHAELVNSNFCQVIPARGLKNADFYGHIYGQWANITEMDIEVAIREVYNNYSYHLALAAQGAEWIETKWLNEEVSEKLLVLLDSLHV